MNIILWIVQGLLAVAFIMAGLMKVSKPVEELREKLGEWIDSFSTKTIKLIGITEIFGALGLILPMLLKTLPLLTPIAAIGLSLTMIGAMTVHIKRKEKKEVMTNFVLLVFSAFIVIGRVYIVPVL
ncbi:DoxX family protein [Marinifilum caeruleilacunae]|uniref:DoxX family protein n=1 Tax=Marinifilum caeruleilacunae TaxID=2499076 RepID=A0ABX1X1X7_9BACT|nr:DoxX family protein [Marinifilum caeruleilacunae]NOU62131.1 DoxX family protein [Marinifilum caeruleilacunae]